MIVLDASALIELLVGTAAGRRIAKRIADPSVTLHVPQLADIEVLHVLRRYVAVGELSLGEAEAAMADLHALDIERHDHHPLLARVWELRSNFNAYDATYVALAEALDGLLLTCDKRLATAPAARGLAELG